MNCDLACRLLEGYLDDRLSQRDRKSLEQHLSLCPRCSDELHAELAFENSVQQTLAASVQSLELSPNAGRAIVQAVEASLQQSVWQYSRGRIVQVTAAAAVTVLLMAALLLLLGRTSIPAEVQQVLLPAASQPSLTLSGNDITIKPQHMHPGEPFIITLPLRSDMAEALDSLHCTLDIDGPTGQYHFGLNVPGPLPAKGTAILRVTPDVLAVASRQRYRMSPTEIFGEPGTYTVRVTLFKPIFTSGQ